MIVSLKWQRGVNKPKEKPLNPQQLGERIRQARETLGLSQDELAVRVGRDQRSISEYENGKRRIYAHDLPTFAEALHVPIIYFFHDVSTADDLDVLLLDVFHQLEIGQRGSFIEAIRLLTKMLRHRE